MPPPTSALRVLRKFLKAMRTPVMLSRVRLATEALSTSSMDCPQIEWMEEPGEALNARRAESQAWSSTS